MAEVAEKPATTDNSQELWEFSLESESWSDHEKKKYQGNLMRRVHRSEKQMHNEHKNITLDEKARCQVLLEISKLQGNLLRPEIQKIQSTLKLETVIGHIIFMSPAVSIVRQIYGRSPTDDLIDLDVNNAFWVYS